jgi:hypothetical protein
LSGLQLDHGYFAREGGSTAAPLELKKSTLTGGRAAALEHHH